MIFFAAIIALTRAEGVAEVLEFEAAGTAGHVSPDFSQWERKITANDEWAVEFREKYSQCDIYIDSRLRQNFKWPSIAEQKAAELLERRNRAQSTLQEAEDRNRILQEAKKRAEDSQAAVDAARAELDAMEAEARAGEPAKRAKGK